MKSKIIFHDSYLTIKRIFFKEININFEDIKKIEIVMNKNKSKIAFLILYSALISVVFYFSIHFPTYFSIISILLIYLLMFHFLNLNDHYLLIDSTHKKSIKVRLKKQDVDKALELIDFVIYLDYNRHTKKLTA